MKRAIRSSPPAGSGGDAAVRLELERRVHPRLAARVERVAQARRRRCSATSTVSMIIRPGMIASSGWMLSSSTPTVIIVPQEEFGGCTPAPRKERPASKSMLLAIIRVKKTMIVEARLGRISPNITRSGPGPLGDRGLDELFLAQRQHLAADRPGDVGHGEDADDEDRVPDRAAGDFERADASGRRPRARCPARARSGRRAATRSRRACGRSGRRPSRGSSRRAGRGRRRGWSRSAPR